jgi:hypothetical protein
MDKLDEILVELREMRKLLEKSRIADDDYNPGDVARYIVRNDPHINKSELGRILGVSRTQLYR